MLGVTNRTMGYLSPEETYGTGLYQEQQSPFAPGCLEQTIERRGASELALEELTPHRRLLRADHARAQPLSARVPRYPAAVDVRPCQRVRRRD